ncbi:hypothetical protein [Frateuria aurantia]|uniref:Ribbon-helix-helix protein, copG family n=1 Tax=Frateuria aurantia (strain ATCC 33424 / DSM 6220 / KCTC 2777 / LMG 1558 / NBRC 3245 / NCIMB 13370) TaxID=767434 RepID=H8L644_FRAAD|nr:hypothetical protein [Frateuria aurantia]AFC85888.1 hypothetical protein Fraau_1465 [Frateuria aurantia DSM 6220]
MYENPTHIRDKIIKVRLNADERNLVDALARINKTQPSVFLRDLVIQGLAVVTKDTPKQSAA